MLNFDENAAMRYSSLRLAGVCVAGVILWLSLLYLVNVILNWPVLVSYSVCALLGAAILYFVLQWRLRAMPYIPLELAAQIREHHEAEKLGIRYDLLSKATKDAIYDWDIVQDTVIWNHGLYTLFGYQPNDALALRNWWERKLHPEDRERMLTRLQQKLESGARHYEERYRVLCANGHYKHVLSRGYMVHENNAAIRMIGLIQDIDHIVEKQQIIQRLQDQHKGLREIAWINSHEIRKPVVSILGITQLFDKSNENRSLNNQLIEWLYTSTAELDEIIHKLEEKVREIENGNEN